ncbi:MAG: endonuclease/exonuclease/phosphatase family protein [Lachnospiraceae bacterium]
MKLLTCNVHSLRELDCEKKLKYFVDAVCRENFDIIAIQEVSQTMGGEKVKEIKKEYYMGPDEIEITADNYAMTVSSLLEKKGYPYYWGWTPAKIGYKILDEGIAILSRKKPEDISSFYISSSEDYQNWRSRKALGIKVDNVWYYCVHMGWWQEEGDCFSDQWERLRKHFPEGGDVYVMGDFNNPAHIRREGYDTVLSSGFFDTYHLARQRDDGMTVVKAIDGWRDKEEKNKMRIDFIFKNNSKSVLSSKVIFNGKNEPIISDHFGVMIEEGE